MSNLYYEALSGKTYLRPFAISNAGAQFQLALQQDSARLGLYLSSDQNNPYRLYLTSNVNDPFIFVAASTSPLLLLAYQLGQGIQREVYVFSANATTIQGWEIISIDPILGGRP